jgi:hypothetical protein
MDSLIEFPPESGLSGEIGPGIPLKSYLNSPALESLAETIEREYYDQETPRWHYPVVLMLKLLVIKCFHQQSYARAIYSLTQEDWHNLGVSPEDRLPHPATLQHFVKYRLGVDGMQRVMMLTGSALTRKLDGESIGIIDSTPLEALRYNQDAPYNPHYQIQMDKAHIMHLGRYPLAMVYSGGTDTDITHLPRLIATVAPMQPNVVGVQLDSAYDSYEAHAQIWYYLDAWPCIALREGAVIQEEGTEKRIHHWVNKLWKEGGDVHAPLEEQLRFLFEQGRGEQVGMFFRNKNTLNPEFSTLLHGRGDCERVHNHIKTTVGFRLKGIRHESRELYILLNFIVYQLLLLVGCTAEIENPSVLSALI